MIFVLKHNYKTPIVYPMITEMLDFWILKLFNFQLL